MAAGKKSRAENSGQGGGAGGGREKGEGKDRFAILMNNTKEGVGGGGTDEDALNTRGRSCSIRGEGKTSEGDDTTGGRRGGGGTAFVSRISL